MLGIGSKRITKRPSKRQEQRKFKETSIIKARTDIKKKAVVNDTSIERPIVEPKLAKEAIIGEFNPMEIEDNMCSLVMEDKDLDQIDEQKIDSQRPQLITLDKMLSNAPSMAKIGISETNTKISMVDKNSICKPSIAESFKNHYIDHFNKLENNLFVRMEKGETLKRTVKTKQEPNLAVNRTKDKVWSFIQNVSKKNKIKEEDNEIYFDLNEDEIKQTLLTFNYGLKEFEEKIIKIYDLLDNALWTPYKPQLVLSDIFSILSKHGITMTEGEFNFFLMNSNEWIKFCNAGRSCYLVGKNIESYKADDIKRYTSHRKQSIQCKIKTVVAQFKRTAEKNFLKNNNKAFLSNELIWEKVPRFIKSFKAKEKAVALPVIKTPNQGQSTLKPTQTMTNLTLKKVPSTRDLEKYYSIQEIRDHLTNNVK